MRRIPRLATLALLSAALLAAGSSASLAATPATPDSATPGSWPGPTGAEPGHAGAAVHAAAVTTTEQEAVAAYWTPQRMRSATPIDALAADLLTSLPTGGAPAVGDPVVIGPTAAPVPDDAGVQAFPEIGDPWIGGGAVESTVGRVFFDFQGQPASCSGNAVTSDNRSTVMTAGHCIKLEGSFHTNWVFVPGYDDGDDPFGTWTAARTFVTPQWNANENINFDIGAAVVNPLGGDLLTDAVGGQGIAFNQPRGLAMYAFGFPAAAPYDGSELIYCSGNTFNDPLFTTAIGMDCDMTGGSSGGPWFFNFNEATGAGIQNSVNSFGYIFLPDVMFGPYFGSEGADVYDTAQSS